MGRKLAFAVLVGALLVGGAACGGSKKTAATTTTGGGSATTTAAMTHETTTTTTTPTTTASSSSGTPSFASTKNCQELASLAAKLTSSVTGQGSTDVNKMAGVIEGLANAAPSAIRADFKTLADAYSSFVKAYTSAGLKAGQTPTPAQIAKLSTAAKSLTTPKLTRAENHLQTWVQQNCKGVKAP